MSEDKIETIAFAPLARTDFVRYAGASGDFNPLHHDARFAETAGLPDVMGHGMLSAGLLATALTRWFGTGALKSYAIRFQTPVWPGDRLVARGRIAGKTPDGSDGAILDVDVSLSREGGEAVVAGTARVARSRSEATA